MAQFTFEGDFEILADPQIKLVESALQQKGFTNGKVVVEPVGQKGDNYIAHVKRFIYKADDGTTFKMVGKIAPVAEEVRIMMKTMILFNNEIVMYEQVIPKLNVIQKSAGIADNEKVRFPTCYGVVSDAPYEFILLEDLKEEGFEMLDRMKPLDDESFRLVVKDLANFHSLSYALKCSEPVFYQECLEKLINVWALVNDDPDAQQFFEATEENLVKMLYENYDISDKYKNVVKGSLTQASVIARKLQNEEDDSKYHVIQHGDCWNNNVLFRLEDGKPIEEVMIDYQLSSKSSPAGDLLYLIFNCTDYVSRKKHYQEWINYYHECLDHSLNQYGLKADRIFPKDQLEADLKKYGRLMVNLGVLLSSMLVTESKDAVDFINIAGGKEELAENVLAQMTGSAMDGSTKSKLRERIVGLIDSAFEFGLI